MTTTLSKHIDAVLYRWLKPVRAVGPVVHYVLREAAEVKPPPLALCGTQAAPTDRGTRRWRLVHGRSSSKVCATCHAMSCRESSRVDWS